MNRKLTLILSSLLLTIAVVMIGCTKSAPTAPAANNTSSAAAVEQTICPITGNPINKSVFVEYQGKKVYFCCEQCKAKFQKDPEKYLNKLPQFKK